MARISYQNSIYQSFLHTSFVFNFSIPFIQPWHSFFNFNIRFIQAWRSCIDVDFVFLLSPKLVLFK